MPPRQLVVAMALASLLVVIGGTCGLLAIEPDVPIPRPFEQESITKATTTRYRYTTGFFKALLVSDARSYGIPDFNPDVLLRPNRFRSEYRGRFTLKPGGPGLETEHLVITAVVDKTWVQKGDARYRTDHLNLRIANRTDRYLAYFVGTAISNENLCGSKGNMPHDALTIAPRDTIERSECFYHRSNDLWIERVDTMEISELGYYYVGRLMPLTLGVEPRIAEQHRVPGGARFCRHVPKNEIEAAGSRETRWPAVVDFYSRHNCDEYWFFSAYRMRETPAQALLPAQPPEPEAPAPAAPR